MVVVAVVAAGILDGSCALCLDTFYMDSYDTSLPSQHVYRKIEVASCTEFA